MKSIDLSTPSVRTILEDRKTQIRWVIKKDISNKLDIDTDGNIRTYICRTINGCYKNIVPYQIGDILWVREAWTEVSVDGSYAPPCYQGTFYYYRADDSGIETCGIFNGWHSPIHMPFEAARILLLVKDIRMEQLQEITELVVEFERIEKP